MTIETEWRNYDVVVVGSGGAGSMAARAAAEEGASVLVVSKDPIGCSDTKISEGNATVRQVATDDDSEETLSENLCMAGGNLPVKDITDAFGELFSNKIVATKEACAHARQEMGWPARPG